MMLQEKNIHCIFGCDTLVLMVFQSSSLHLKCVQTNLCSVVWSCGVLQLTKECVCSSVCRQVVLSAHSHVPFSHSVYWVINLFQFFKECGFIQGETSHVRTVDWSGVEASVRLKQPTRELLQCFRQRDWSEEALWSPRRSCHDSPPPTNTACLLAGDPPNCVARAPGLETHPPQPHPLHCAALAGTQAHECRVSARLPGCVSVYTCAMWGSRTSVVCHGWEAGTCWVVSWVGRGSHVFELQVGKKFLWRT